MLRFNHRVSVRPAVRLAVRLTVRPAVRPTVHLGVYPVVRAVHRPSVRGVRQPATHRLRLRVCGTRVWNVRQPRRGGCQRRRRHRRRRDDTGEVEGAQRQRGSVSIHAIVLLGIADVLKLRRGAGAGAGGRGGRRRPGRFRSSVHQPLRPALPPVRLGQRHAVHLLPRLARVGRRRRHRVAVSRRGRGGGGARRHCRRRRPPLLRLHVLEAEREARRGRPLARRRLTLLTTHSHLLHDTARCRGDWRRLVLARGRQRSRLAGGQRLAEA